MIDRGVGSWPARRARMTPDAVALVQDDRETTYAELEHRSLRLARGLRARGVGRGDRVAFLGLNSPALVLAMFATARLGAVFLPLNTRLAAPELAYVLEDSGARLLLLEEGFEATAPDVVGFARGEGLSALEADGEALEEVVELDDLFMIQYTSGTSGRPKGVMLTHGNITWNVYNLLVDVDLASDERSLVTAPLFHTAALNQVLFPTLLKGGTCLIEERFDPARALRLIDDGRVTVLFGVTSMYLAIQNQPGFAEADLSGLRHALSGGAPIPESLLRTWAERGVGIIQGYGLTESSPGATMLRAVDTVRKAGTAGTACFFTDVRVARPDLAGVDVGEPGEVLVSGPNVTPGYWRNPEATAAAFSDVGGEAWLHTGDLATLDDEGYLRIVDRVKDMYISGGENVYPAEVEAAIHHHPAVAECAVIGVADERWGEVGRAFVVVREGESLDEQSLLAHLDGRLARYKIPRSVVFLTELPHNASGKLLKRELNR
ncbi:p-hydroxycinnamoyl-CoA synthetase [Nocardioides mangrovicus]|uniref:p-hydroxycinnamoyl-CoA synthetase n=1 Tax=Nocardioides mangrovicus TaxID=2478913 RepID=A0A3L8NZN0_9ACTN|nr:long-chain fatty acid--CoA ligase [Nocardioides mangrovicus]RLV48231.1 p-hydroxycinnamoyl-CoA synthetase [Nocardioides mangrovicus]